MGRRRACAFLALALAIGVLATAADSAGQGRAPGGRPIAVTPVEGPSTLHHLGLTIERSSMGWDGQWGPPPSNTASHPDHVTRAAGSGGPFLLDGGDVYRLSCRPCHKPDGSGGPPEINSLIGPVQSASAPWMTQRMKAAGRPVDPAFIRQLTASTEIDLRKRLKVGGHSMPSFDHLSDDEIAVLRPYLDELASVPGAARRPRLITESPDRVGELIVKGTCHICHDATGANEPTTVLSGVIPSLATMSHQHTVFQFVQKAHEGSRVPLSAGNVTSRGRMPVFAYLSEAEIAAAYSYLIAHPPR
jgi:mono/diheme cytochrome c family protein